jgi:hypothetical protein
MFIPLEKFGTNEGNMPARHLRPRTETEGKKTERPRRERQSGGIGTNKNTT